MLPVAILIVLPAHFQHAEVYATLMQLDVETVELCGCVGYAVFRMADLELLVSHLDEYGFEYRLYMMSGSHAQQDTESEDDEEEPVGQ